MSINQDKIEQLVALLSGLLEGKQKKVILDELQKDSELSEYYDLLEQLYAVFPSESKSVYSASKKLSLSLYQDFIKKQASSKISFGVQVFDSSLLPLPEGVRPASVDTRQLKYQVGDFQVELTVYPITIDSVEIIGQIHTVEKSQKITITAELNKKSQTVEIDEFGLFRFKRVEAGDCRLKFIFENSKEGIIELNL